MKKDEQSSHSTRISKEAYKYWQKCGSTRNLDKFMRFSSPSPSHNSNALSSAINKLRVPSSSSTPNDISLPALLVIEEKRNNEIHSKKSHSVTKTIDNDNAVLNIMLDSPKRSCFVSPKNNTQTTTKNCKNNFNIIPPDSVVTSQKRLEWDSLGDVGYQKSQLTYNDSIERLALKNYKQSPLLGHLSCPTLYKASQNNFKISTKSDQFLIQSYDLKVPQKDACSSQKSSEFCGKQVLTKKKEPIENKTRDQPQIFKDKSAQTSWPQLVSTREVQTTNIDYTDTLSTNSGESATLSRLYYYPTFLSSEASLNKKSNKHEILKAKAEADAESSSNVIIHTSKNAISHHKIVQNTQEVVTNGVNESQSTNSYEIASKVGTNLKNSKNLSAGFDNMQSQELNLGVELICSMAESKSLNSIQKKMLLRYIANRMACSEISSSNNSYESGVKSVHQNSLGISKSISGATEHSKKYSCSVFNGSKITGPSESDSTKMCKSKLPPNIFTQNASNDINKKTSNGNLKINTSSSHILLHSTRGSEISVNAKTKLPIKNHSFDKTTKSESTASKTSAKINVKEIESNTGSGETFSKVGQETMCEWLNPLTQAEVDYEKNKIQYVMGLSKDGKIKKNLPKATHIRTSTGAENSSNCKQKTQLVWIESEIERLENLRKLIKIKDENSNTWNNKNDVTLESEFNNRKNSQKISDDEKIYDSVMIQDEMFEMQTSQSPLFKINNIEIPVYEKYQHSVYVEFEDHSSGSLPHQQLKCAQTLTDKHKLIITEKKVKLKPSHNHKENRRNKIDTPKSSTASESVRSFAQQRKNQFLQHYMKKKHQNSKSLLVKQLKQEEDLFKKQQNWQQHQDNFKKNICEKSDSRQTQYAIGKMMHSRMPLDCTNHIYYQVLSSPLIHPANLGSCGITSLGTTTTSSNSTRTKPISTSSILYLSSDISIPIGTANVTESSTTTHQYDVGEVNSVSTAGQNVTFKNLPRPIYEPAYSTPDELVQTGWKKNHNGLIKTACFKVRPRSIAYILEFQKSVDPVDDNDVDIFVSSSTHAHTQGNTFMSLQDHLQRARPGFCAQSKKRRAILNQMQVLRSERRRELNKIIETASLNSLDYRLQNFRPAPISQIRVFSTKEMKALTNKRCKMLPEVIHREQRELEERRRRGNRVLRDVFNHRLQRRVHNGKTSLNHSRTII